jgi:hypothetical protein
MFLIRFLYLSSVVISESFPKPQFGNIEIYEVDISQNQENQYQNNPFLNFVSSGHQNNNYGNSGNSLNQNRPNLNNQEQYLTCDHYWSYQNDFNEKWGLITIPDPFYNKSILRITLSLAARLSTVRFFLL